MAACVYALGGVLLHMNRNHISCGALNLILSLTFNFTTLSLVLSELCVVLTFNLTKLLVISHPATAADYKIKMRKCAILRKLLTPQSIAITWIVSQLVWSMPTLVVILFSEEFIWNNSASVCPTKFDAEIEKSNSAQTICIYLLALILTRFLSQVVDNFGLRRSFQISGICMLLSLVAYILAVKLDAANLNSEIFVSTFSVQLIVPIHICNPLWRSLRDKPTSNYNSCESSIKLLHDYLLTPSGYNSFSQFCQLEFRTEYLLAWKTLADYTNGVGAADEIFEKYFAPNASISLRHISAHLLERYQLLFSSRHKYKVHPKHQQDESEQFEPLRLEILRILVADTLSRFQAHELGQDWSKFVEEHQVRSALELVLQNSSSKSLISFISPATQKKQTEENLTIFDARLEPIESDPLGKKTQQLFQVIHQLIFSPA